MHCFVCLESKDRKFVPRIMAANDNMSLLTPGGASALSHANMGSFCEAATSPLAPDPGFERLHVRRTAELEEIRVAREAKKQQELAGDFLESLKARGALLLDCVYMYVYICMCIYVCVYTYMTSILDGVLCNMYV